MWCMFLHILQLCQIVLIPHTSHRNGECMFLHILHRNGEVHCFHTFYTDMGNLTQACKNVLAGLHTSYVSMGI